MGFLLWKHVVAVRTLLWSSGVVTIEKCFSGSLFVRNIKFIICLTVKSLRIGLPPWKLSFMIFEWPVIAVFEVVKVFVVVLISFESRPLSFLIRRLQIITYHLFDRGPKHHGSHPFTIIVVSMGATLSRIHLMERRRGIHIVVIVLVRVVSRFRFIRLFRLGALRFCPVCFFIFDFVLRVKLVRSV